MKIFSAAAVAACSGLGCLVLAAIVGAALILKIEDRRL